MVPLVRAKESSFNATSPITTVLVALFALLLLSNTCLATIATEVESRQVAENWLTAVKYERGAWAGDPKAQVTDMTELYGTDGLLARCYAVEPSGYILVPALREMPPVKLSSETARLDVKSEDGMAQLIREVLEDRMRVYTELYGSASAAQPSTGDIFLDPAYAEQWDRFTSDPAVFAATLASGIYASRESYGPFLTTSWDQGYPYNNFCPMGDGGRTVVGCVATAAAQIMTYWQYPAAGEGSHSYWWDGDQSCWGNTSGAQLSATYSDGYDWANIIDDCDVGCNQAQQDAVAELCYEVGVAFNMDYGACGSGAYTSHAVTVFPTYFKYDNSITVAARNQHTSATWSDVIHDQMALEHPVQYRISGHSIVCDGWRDTQGYDQFHINYGWDDGHTTWYTVDNLFCDWSGCSYLVEYAVINIFPEEIPCNDPDEWTVTDGATHNDVSTEVIALADSTMGFDELTLTATASNPYKSATITIAQTIEYEICLNSGCTVDAVGIYKNGVLQHGFTCNGTTQRDSGLISVVVGDVIVAECSVLKADGSTDREIYPFAKFTYRTAEYPVLMTQTGYTFAGTTYEQAVDQPVTLTATYSNPVKIATMPSAQTVSYDLYLNAGCTVYDVSITKNGTPVRTLTCNGSAQSATGSFAVVAGDIVRAYCMPDKSALDAKEPYPYASFSYMALGSSQGDFQLTHTDPCGNELWQATRTTTADDRLGAAILTSDGGYVLAGNRDAGTETDFYVVKYNANGVFQWDYVYDAAYDDHADDIVEVSDGYVIAGVTQTPTSDVLWGFKLSLNGSLVWAEPYLFSGGSAIEAGVCVRPDGGLLFCTSDVWTTDDAKVWLYRVAADGNGQSVTSLLDDGYDQIMTDITPTANGYVITGTTNEHSSTDAFLLTIDNNLAQTDYGTYGYYGTDVPSDVDVADGGYVFAGWTDGLGTGSLDHWVVKVDQSLDKEWEGRFGWSGIEKSAAVEPTADGGYILAGDIVDFGDNQSDYQWIKFLDPPPVAPVLVSPANGAQYCNSAAPLLDWNPVAVGDIYRVQVDNNSDFSSPLFDEDFLIATQFQMPTVGISYYYWRVQARNQTAFGGWSPVRYFRVKSCSSPSCPVLFAQNGDEFTMENPLLTACEKSNYVDIVTDYYKVRSDVTTVDGTVNFQLRELEDEISYVHDLQLITVDHSADTRIACAVDGSIIAYSEIGAPLSAIDDQGVDRLAAVTAKDGELFTADGPGHLIVTFAADGDVPGLYLTDQPKQLCPIEVITDPAMKVDPVAPEYHDARIEVLGSNGQWIELPTNPTRENIGETFVLPKDAAVTDGMVTYRLSWDNGYSADVIGRLVEASTEPTVMTHTIKGGLLQPSNAAGKAISGFTPGEPVVLRNGDVLDFAFAVEPVPAGQVRDFVVMAVGRYQPDYDIYSNLLPGQFQLYANYPNPFNPTTTISYDIPKNAHVTLEVFNVLGRRVTVLVDEAQAAGHYQVEWNGTDGQGHSVASGIYFYRINADDYRDSRKMMLLK